MNPGVAAKRQIERYRRMTGEERLATALRLHAFSCDMARQGIRAQHPAASETEVDALLRERLLRAAR